MTDIVVVGAPGSGKSEIIQALASKEEGLAEYAVGPLADYRYEVWLATQRVMASMKEKESTRVYFHSLLDSVAHSTVRVTRLIELEDDVELLRWQLTLHLIARMLIDSFRADKIIFLRGNDGQPFNKDVEDALAAALKEFNAEYVTVETPEQATQILQEIMSDTTDGPGDNNKADGEN